MTIMWLHLEAGTARVLQEDGGVFFDVPPHPGGGGWHAVVIEAAETYFPEAGIEDLPMWAAAEVDRGLTGPLRTQIAATQPDDPALPALRDDLMIALTDAEGNRSGVPATGWPWWPAADGHPPDLASAGWTEVVAGSSS